MEIFTNNIIYILCGQRRGAERETKIIAAAAHSLAHPLPVSDLRVRLIMTLIMKTTRGYWLQTARTVFFFRLMTCKKKKTEKKYKFMTYLSCSKNFKNSTKFNRNYTPQKVKNSRNCVVTLMYFDQLGQQPNWQTDVHS